MFKSVATFVLASVLFSGPVIAANWQKIGVSSTGEMVALDLQSISVNSRYDVRFRYLIGKDLVNATANCDSSKITPDKGKPFVPHLSGASREMLNVVCATQSQSSSEISIPWSSIQGVRDLSEYPLGRNMPSAVIHNDLRVACRLYAQGYSAIEVYRGNTDRNSPADFRDYAASIVVISRREVCP